MGTKGPERVQNEIINLDMDRQLEEERETAYRANLLLATALVAQQGMALGKKPEEAVDYFSKTFEIMQDWYRAKPLKQQIEQIMESVLPERYY